MKIVRLTTYLDFGGIEKRLMNISNVQDANDWLFCAINRGGTAEKAIQENGKKVFCFHWPYKIPSLGTIYKLYQFFKKEKPDVVHTSGAEANFHGILAAKLASVPVIVAEEVGIPKQSNSAKKIFSFIFSLADVVVGNSKQVLQYLSGQNKVPAHKLRLVPNPIIFPALPAESAKEPHVFSIVSVSRLESVKNIESVIRVLSILQEAADLKIKYTIVGDGIHHQVLTNLVRDLKLEDVVHFVGFQNNPYPFLLSADLYVLTSFSEGFSNSLMEAMYAGVPSLTTRVGAAEEMIAHGKNGWIVEVNDDSSLAQTIKSIIVMDAESRRQIGTAGKNTIVQNYSLENHLALLYQMYTPQK